MACYYNIKLPNGGEVKILATISAITDAETIAKILDVAKDHYSAEDKTVTWKTPLIQTLRDLNLDLSAETLKTVVSNSTANTLIDHLNKALSDVVGVDDHVSSLQHSLKKQIWKGTAITYITPDQKETTISLAEFLTKLQAPVGKSYFGGINSNGLLSVKSLTDLTDDFESAKEAMAQINFTLIPANALKNILNKAFYQKDRNTKMFFSLDFNSDVHDAVVVKPEEGKDPLIFYSGLNDMSLFMGTFKYLASNIPTEDLRTVLETFNNTLKPDSPRRIDLTDLSSEKFFLGEFVITNKKTKFIDPKFNQILKAKESSIIDALVELIIPALSTSESGQEGLRSNFKTLFKYVNSAKFARGLNAEEDATIDAYIAQTDIERDLTNELRSNIMKPYITDEVKNYHYTKTKTDTSFTTPEDLYQYLVNNVTKGQDLVFVSYPKPKGGKPERDRFIVPTEFRITPSGVQVFGFYEQGGKIIWRTTGKITLEMGAAYRKFVENTGQVYEEDAIKLPSEKSIVILAPDGEFLPPELVMSAAVRGGTLVSKDREPIPKKKATEGTEESEKVTKKVVKESTLKTHSNVIKGVYPGVIKGNSYRDVFEFTLGIYRVESLTTDASLFEDEFTEAQWTTKVSMLEAMDVITKLPGFTPVSPGDYVQTMGPKNKNVYNKVIATTDDNVYILIKSEKGYVSKAIPKASILKIYKKKTTYTIADLQTIGAFHSSLSRDASISSTDWSVVENYEAAAEGDYVVSYNNATASYTIYKITNKAAREGLKLEVNAKASEGTRFIQANYAQIPIDQDNISIITDRSIYTESAINVAELNNWFLSTEEKLDAGDNIHYEEARYFIPKSTKVSELKFLPSGNLIGGIVKSANSIARGSTTDPKEEGYIDVTEDMIKLLNSKRGTQGEKLLIKVKGDNYYVRYDASLYKVAFQPSDIEYLNAFNYIEFVHHSDPSKSSGKIYKIIGRSENTLTVEYSTFNNRGKIVTIQKQLNLTTDLGKIKWLYTMKGSQDYKTMWGNKLQKQRDKLENPVKTAEDIIKERKTTLGSIAKTFQDIFKIPVLIESHSEPGLVSKKAWIQVDSDNKPTIVLNLNSANMNTVDLVHEYLHLFLMGLKYESSVLDKITLYEGLLLDYKQSFATQSSNNKTEQAKIDKINQTQDWSTLEEFFVKDMSEAMVTGEFDHLVNYDKFKAAFVTSLRVLGMESNTVNTQNVFSILNSRMSEIFPRKNAGLSMNGVIFFEANFQAWLTEQIKNEQIKITCK